MRILTYNHDGTKAKQVFNNNSAKLGYTNLQYSSSLEGLGSCSFQLPKSDPSRLIGKNYSELLNEEMIGLERVFIQDDEGNILWGGVNTNFDSNTDVATVRCTELKHYFTKLKSPVLEVTGNGLEAIEFILAQSGSAITLHPDSQIVDTVDIKVGSNASVYDVVKDIIEASYSRWILVHEKVGGLVETKLLCRSILGVSPAGVGLDKSKSSTEVPDDEKRFFIYDEVNTERSNIADYKVSQKHNSAVSKCIIQYKDSLGAVQEVVSEEPVGQEHVSPNLVETFFGKNEKIITSLEIRNEDHAQAIANREVQFPDASVQLNMLPTDKDNLFVGDRVDFQIFSGGFITGGVDNFGNYKVTASKWRIQEKTVAVGDGTLIIQLGLSARNTTPYEYNILERIANTKKDTRKINGEIISS